jgi:hypothetical protein
MKSNMIKEQKVYALIKEILGKGKHTHIETGVFVCLGRTDGCLDRWMDGWMKMDIMNILGRCCLKRYSIDV